MAKNYVTNAREPSLGVGFLKQRSLEAGTRTFQFASGERTYKEAYCKLYIKPSLVPPPSVGAKQKARKPKPVVAEPSSTPRAEHEGFEQEILAHRTDGAYAVYADWLQLHQDPRGELIVAHQQNAIDRARALLAQHTTYFVPKGLAAVLAIPRRGGPRCDVVWRSGFIDELHLAKDVTPTWAHVDLAAITRETVAHPSGKLLRKIVLGAPGDSPWTYLSQLSVLSAPTVEELVVGESQDSNEVALAHAGDLAPAVHGLPLLKKLVVKAGSSRFGKRLTHPLLESIEIEARSFASKDLDALFGGALPALHTLAITADGLELAERSLVKLVSNKGMPKLRHLTLRGTRHTHAIVEALRGAEWVSRLETLILDRSDLDPAVAATVAEQLSHIRIVELSAKPASRFTLTERQVIARSPDRASMNLARKLADPAKWQRLGYDVVQRRVWGGYVGGDRYDVWLELERLITGCDCASPKYPCKHALALALLVARAHPFADAPMPPRVRHTTIRRSNYGTGPRNYDD